MFNFPFCHLITGRMIPILGGPGCYNSAPKRLSELSYNSYEISQIRNYILYTYTYIPLLFNIGIDIFPLE